MKRINDLDELDTINEGVLTQYKYRQMYILRVHDLVTGYDDYFIYSYQTLVAIFHKQESNIYMVETTNKYSPTTFKQLTMLKNELTYWFDLHLKKLSSDDLYNLKEKIKQRWYNDRHAI